MERRDPIVRRVDREKKGFESFSHPLNPERSQMRGFSLSDAVGLTRIAVHLAVLPPGKESFVYHSHAVEEEWLYVLAGRGRIEIDGELPAHVGPQVQPLERVDEDDVLLALVLAGQEVRREVGATRRARAGDVAVTVALHPRDLQRPP